jgi:hypothetical protein
MVFCYRAMTFFFPSSHQDFMTHLSDAPWTTRAFFCNKKQNKTKTTATWKSKTQKIKREGFFRFLFRQQSRARFGFFDKMSQETLASILGGVVRLRAERGPRVHRL